jgi:acetolactate synthase-1/2/3 large subunit
MSITKHSFVVDDANKIEAIIDEAIKIATSGRPGPVLIDFPKDISLQEITENKKLEKPLYYTNMALEEISKEKIQEFLGLLNNSKKPILLIGQ